MYMHSLSIFNFVGGRDIDTVLASEPSEASFIVSFLTSAGACSPTDVVFHQIKVHHLRNLVSIPVPQDSSNLLASNDLDF